MMVHPVNIVIVVLDLAALALAGAAAVTAGRTLLHWRPTASDRRQIRLEAVVDIAAIHSRAAVVTFAAATLLLVTAVAYFLPPVIPGAMCGTGVMEAMGTAGVRALLLRGTALAIMAAWWTLSRLDAAHPLSPITPAAARWWLLLVPVAAVAAMATVEALWGLDPHQPVSCCALIYDAALKTNTGPSALPILAPHVLIAWTIGGAALIGVCLRCMRTGPPPGIYPGAMMSAGAMIWAAASAVVLTRVLSAYIFEVLDHPCPWCLYLPDHAAAGFPLFGALAVICLESVAGGVSLVVGGRVASLADDAATRLRTSARRIGLCTIGFMLLAGAPAWLWRLRFGLWLH